MQKLRVVKAKLKVWNSSDFGNIVVKMDEIKNKLLQFDMLGEGRSEFGGKGSQREMQLD